MSKQTSMSGEFVKGLWKQNPTLRQLLGLCPTLAVSTAAINGVGMGLATTFVLVCASLMISLIRKLIPGQVRIASYSVVIAAFVTVVDLPMKAKFPAMSKSLGAFIPLIVVNCIILGRAEAFASKNNPLRSIVDALGMGVGFTASLTFMGSVREILGNGTIFGVQIMPASYDPWIVMILPAGGFIVLSLTLGFVNIITRRREQAALRTARLAIVAKEA